MLPYVHGNFRSRRAYRLNAVTALSAALLSIFALFAVFCWLHAPQHPIAIRQPYDARDDDQLVQEAVRVFAASLWKTLVFPQGYLPKRTAERNSAEPLMFLQNVLETDTLILRPRSTSSMLILLHRCGHSPLQWWHATIGCHDCFGAHPCPSCALTVSQTPSCCVKTWLWQP